MNKSTSKDRDRVAAAKRLAGRGDESVALSLLDIAHSLRRLVELQETAVTREDDGKEHMKLGWRAKDARKETAVEHTGLSAVYKRYEHMGELLCDRKMLPDDLRGKILYDLWQAVRESQIEQETAVVQGSFDVGLAKDRISAGIMDWHIDGGRVSCLNDQDVAELITLATCAVDEDN